MLRIWLVRHGETQWNHSGLIQGQRDVELNDRGQRQAARTADALAGVPFRAIYSSDLTRALETAQAIAAHVTLPIQSMPALREASFGIFQGMTLAEARTRYPAEQAAWVADRVRVAPPDGETLLQLAERVEAAVAEIVAAVGEGDVLLVTHGGPIRVLLCRCLGMDLARHWQFRLDNASISIIEWTERGPIVWQVNDVSHLHVDGWAAELGRESSLPASLRE